MNWLKVFARISFMNLQGITANDENVLMSAAGNIKYIFNDEASCSDFVKIFPKIVMEMAPGITISQAVVSFEGEYPKQTTIDSLEIKLKAKRNKVSTPIETGFMVLERARRTGGVVFGDDENMNKDKNDEATILKLRSSKNAKTLFHKISGLSKSEIDFGELAINISDITKSGNNSWIAVIHADGNGLGNILQNYGRIITENTEFKKFSELIQSSTENACQIAFKKIEKIEKYKYPIRPVVIGGDDVTIIIRADLALDFYI
ncbi:MAG: hypothetical protein IPL23_15630 [Saprospiraceae bacterium]|nr:hypothetical protein [Saprospiraceae bacterium]